MKRILWITIVWLASFARVAGCAELSAPERVVAQFCKADMEGVNLSGEAYKKSGVDSIVLPLEGEGPAWDKSVLIKKFKILPSKPVTTHFRTAQITVEYSVLGEFDSGLDISTNKRTETYIFHLKRVHGKWKVLEPQRDLPPHISIETAISYTKSWEPGEWDDRAEFQKKYREMMKKLKELQGG
jgi:hypothetical protein